MEEELTYLDHFRNLYDEFNIDGNDTLCCKHCNTEMFLFGIVFLKYSSDKSYGAICDECFYRDNVTLEQIIEYYTSRNNYENSFNRLQYNWMLDSIEEHIHSGILRDKYEDYIRRNRDKLLTKLIEEYE